VALAAAGASAGPSKDDDAARTSHVRVRGDVPLETRREFAALAEAAYPQWKSYFGAEPRHEWLPLDLVATTTRDAFLTAVHEAGAPGEFAGAGGYYHPASKTSYLYLQPHASSSRLLVLHELTHQFQYKAVQDNADRTPVWHKEGLAEHFGFHRRTEKGLETGALDVVAIDDRPVQCAERVRLGKIDPWAIGTGAATPDYTDSLAMVEALLRTKDDGLKAAFRDWEHDVVQGAPGPSRFEKAFRGKKERLEAALRETWGGFRRTWSIVYVAWDEKDGEVTGRGMPWAFLQGGRPMSFSNASVEARVSLGTSTVAAGLAIGVKGADDLVSAEVTAQSRVRLRRKRGGAWTPLGEVAPAGGTVGRAVPLRLFVEGADLVVTTDGLPALRVPWASAGLSPTDLDGPAGLIAESGEAKFAGSRAGGP
jgi:hypothetical protein